MWYGRGGHESAIYLVSLSGKGSLGLEAPLTCKYFGNHFFDDGLDIFSIESCIDIECVAVLLGGDQSSAGLPIIVTDMQFENYTSHKIIPNLTC